jgi:hypothetical protein
MRSSFVGGTTQSAYGHGHDAEGIDDGVGRLRTGEKERRGAVERGLF